MTVLLVDDDPQDRMLMKDAFQESGIPTNFQTLEDGEQLFDYLHQDGAKSAATLPPPAIILLDLNLPKKDGRQILKELKSDPMLRRIPVIILTTSRSDDDIRLSYENGASSFITKPTTYRGLVEMVQKLGRYWLETVQLPKH